MKGLSISKNRPFVCSMAVTLIILLALLAFHAKPVHAATAFNAKAKPKFTMTKCYYSEGKVTIQWKKIKGAKKYIVYRAPAKKGGKFKVFATTKKPSLKKASKGQYYYKVRAISGKKKGAYSAKILMFPATGNTYQRIYINIMNMYGRTVFHSAVKNDSQKTIVFKANTSYTIDKIDPETGKVVDSWTNTFTDDTSIAKGKAEAIVMSAPGNQMGGEYRYILKTTFKAGTKKFKINIGPTPDYTWVFAAK